jgi:hypothetical protein
VEPIETIAVAPTLLEMAGLRDPIQKQFQAQGLFTGQREPESALAYSETFYPFSSFGWNPLRSLESGRYHYIEAPKAELYDLQADPEEQHNLVGEQSAVAAVLKEKLSQMLAQHAPLPKRAQSPELSPETTEKLRALGYMAYRSPVSAEQLSKGLPDPKDKLEDFNAILQATDARRFTKEDDRQQRRDKAVAQDAPQERRVEHGRDGGHSLAPRLCHVAPVRDPHL